MRFIPILLILLSSAASAAPLTDTELASYINGRVKETLNAGDETYPAPQINADGRK